MHSPSMLPLDYNHKAAQLTVRLINNVLPHQRNYDAANTFISNAQTWNANNYPWNEQQNSCWYPSGFRARSPSYL